MSSSLLSMMNGSTSCFTIAMSAVASRSRNFSKNNSLVSSRALNSLARTCRCLKSKGTLWRTYHSKSYQSRPLIRFFQDLKIRACNFPAYRLGRVMHRVWKEKGSISSFCSVLKPTGGSLSTSIFIFRFFPFAMTDCKCRCYPSRKQIQLCWSSSCPSWWWLFPCQVTLPLQ